MAVFSGKFDKVVIVLSTGRTGTMALAQYFQDCYGDVTALHEPRPSRRLRLVSNRYLCGQINREKLIEAFARRRRKLFARIDTPVYIEANNFLHGFLDAFDELFDSPRIVHVVRDPRTFIRSWINFGVFRGRKGLAVRYMPYWLLKPELLDRGASRRWKDMSPYEKLAWYWTAINSELNRGESLFGERYLRLRFEDLFAGAGESLCDLAEWIALPRQSGLAERSRTDRVNASRRDGCPDWDRWSEQERQDVLDHCRELMDYYGYDGTG